MTLFRITSKGMKQLSTLTSNIVSMGNETEEEVTMETIMFQERDSLWLLSRSLVFQTKN